MFSKTKKTPSAQLKAQSDPPPGVFDQAANEFAEASGRATVHGHRMFLLALIEGILLLLAVGGLVSRSDNRVFVPIYVELNKETGSIARPVRIENMRPADAYLKGELGKWVADVFTIDSSLTPQLMRNANQRTRGLGTSQFADFRAKEQILERMTRDPSLQRKATVSSVDITSQPGVAFAFVKTQEAQGITSATASATWRVTLKYELFPPKSEEEIQANPLGLYITSMNVAQEGKTQ